MRSIVSKLKLLIKGSGISQVTRVIWYTINKWHFDREYKKNIIHDIHKAEKVAPGRLLEMAWIVQGVRVDFENASLEVRFLASDMVRISWEPGESPVHYALCKLDWPQIHINYQTSNDGIVAESKDVRISVSTNGCIHFIKPDGVILHTELPPCFTVTPQGPFWIASSTLQSDECLFGLGEHTGKINLVGSTHRFWNQDPGGAYKQGFDPIYMPIPVYLGLHNNGSYLIFHENYHPSTFTSNHDPIEKFEEQVRFSFEGGRLQYYFIPGPPSRALARFTELTGRPSLPPIWSLGYHQSRWGYKTQAEILEIARGFQAHDIPVSAIHLDIDFMDGFRVFSISKQRFPNLLNLSSELDSEGIKLVSIINPGIKTDPNYFLYSEGIQNHSFIKSNNGNIQKGVAWPGYVAFPDFTDSQVRSWWGDQYKILLDKGISGFWHDMNEPPSFTLGAENNLPMATRHQMEGQQGDHRQAHNIYALTMAEAGWEGLRNHSPNRRPWILSRSGWAGIQRYAWNWSGDIESSWEGLGMVVASALSTSLSGQFFIGSDIGGFTGDPSAELYLRWLQLSTFLPFFRTHSSINSSRREPWVFGEPFTSIIRKYINLRYQLIPYLYSLAWQANQSGQPLIRPLFWLDTQDPQLREISDEFLLGDSLLVAPILEEGGRERSVIFPGGNWYGFWDNQKYEGSKKLDISAGIDQIPVFIREGSVIPLQENLKVIFHIYAPFSGIIDQPCGIFYSDAGDGYGDWVLNRFSIQGNNKSFEITCESKGSQQSLDDFREFHVHGIKVNHIEINGQTQSEVSNTITTKSVNKIRFEA